MIKELTVTIWERKIDLPIVYDSLSDNIVTDEQIEAIDNFAKHLEWIELSKSKVEDYCKEALYEDDDNEKKDNIFSYIKPERLYVKREKEYPRIALMCKYRYDPEHGLAVVFSHDGEVEVGIQDIIL